MNAGRLLEIEQAAYDRFAALKGWWIWLCYIAKKKQQLWEKPCFLIETSTFPELICYVTGGSWQQRMSIGWQGPAFWYLLILHGFLPRLIYNLKNNPDYIILTIVMNFTEWVVSLQRKSLICEVFCNQENLFDRCIWRNGRRAGRDMRSIVLMKIRSHLLWNIWRRSRGLTLLAYAEGSEAEESRHRQRIMTKNAEKWRWRLDFGNK